MNRIKIYIRPTFEQSPYLNINYPKSLINEFGQSQQHLECRLLLLSFYIDLLLFIYLFLHARAMSKNPSNKI